MRDFIEIGPTPTNEDCAQVGQDYYFEQAKAEGRRFIDGLTHYFGEPPEGSFFRLKEFPHDFGSYFEVCVYFDDSLPDSIDYAYKVEGNIPDTWEELENNIFTNYENSQY